MHVDRSWRKNAGNGPSNRANFCNSFTWGRATCAILRNRNHKGQSVGQNLSKDQKAQKAKTAAHMYLRRRTVLPCDIHRHSISARTNDVHASRKFTGNGSPPHARGRQVASFRNSSYFTSDLTDCMALRTNERRARVGKFSFSQNYVEHINEFSVS